MPTLLLVDDDMEFAATLAVGLRSHGFDVIRTTTGEGGAEAARRDHPALILLDLGLPRMDGMAMLEHVRGWSSVPVVVLSARDDEASKIKAFEAGADDYLAKPFGIGELVARVRAALRRSVRADGRPLVRAGALTIDLEARQLTRDDVDVHLTATEWRLLEALLAREGEVVPHSDLLQAAWGPDAAASVEYLRVYIGALRRKIEIDSAAPDHIFTSAGTGYRFSR